MPGRIESWVQGEKFEISVDFPRKCIQTSSQSSMIKQLLVLLVSIVVIYQLLFSFLFVWVCFAFFVFWIQYYCLLDTIQYNAILLSIGWSGSIGIVGLMHYSCVTAAATRIKKNLLFECRIFEVALFNGWLVV